MYETVFQKSGVYGNELSCRSLECMGMNCSFRSLECVGMNCSFRGLECMGMNCPAEVWSVWV